MVRSTNTDGTITVGSVPAGVLAVMSVRSVVKQILLLMVTKPVGLTVATHDCEELQYLNVDVIFQIVPSE